MPIGSRFDDFIDSRNINTASSRWFRADLKSNTGRQEFGLDPISAASDPPGRQKLDYIPTNIYKKR